MIHRPVRWSTTRRFTTRLVATLAIVLTLAGTLFAAPIRGDKPSEAPYALIYATVWGPDSKMVYGVKVQVRRAGSKKVIAEQVSNHTGEVAFRVPPGKQDWVLTADVKTSKGKTKPEVIAHVENEERVDVGLHLTE